MNGTEAALAVPAARSIAQAAVDSARSWRWITICSAACATLLDVALLERKHALFSGGFLAVYQFGTALDGLAFVLLAALLNATIAGPLVFAVLVLGRRTGLGHRAVMFAALSAGIIPSAVANFVNYQVWSYLGDAFDFNVMSAMTGHRIAEVFAVASPLMSKPLFVLSCGIAVVAGLTAALHRLSHGRTSAEILLPSVREVRNSCFGLAMVASAAVTAVSVTSDSMEFALRRTPSGQIYTFVLNWLSDVDRDGFGMLRNPKDVAPFDKAIYPYAIDIPGNGVDENGLAGDLPLDAVLPAPPPVASVPWQQRPPVVLFLLESVRADVVGAYHQGRRITPMIDALAAEGLKVESAWAHAGSTTQSRYHLLTGSLIDGRGDSTLLDDFKSQGYDVAYFSGQDDDFGQMGLDYQRVDRFYDARQDVRSRYSTSTSPGSLAVPHHVVESRIREYLANRRRLEAPLFLYVNFHDTHYPYHHDGLERLLDVTVLPPSMFSPGRRSELFGMYLNAVASVDRAIGRVIHDVERQLGQRPAVIVVSDHGESLFDYGNLGHGFALNEVQTRVPMVVRGLPVTITTPFGLADLRRTIDEALSSNPTLDGRPVLRREHSTRLFQYVGGLEAPAQIGWITPQGPITYDFRSDEVGIWDSRVRRRDLIGEPRRMFHELVHHWESLLLARGSTAAATR